MTDHLLTVAQVAEILGTTERFPRRLIAERRIAFARVGRHVRIPSERAGRVHPHEHGAARDAEGRRGPEGGGLMAKRRFGRVRRLSSGRWQARYPGPDGIDRPAGQTFPTKKDAERWLSLKESEILRGAWTNPEGGKVTVGEWAQRWMAMNGPHFKVKTTGTYASLLRSLILPRFESVPLASIRPITVGEWVASMTTRGLSPSRVRQAYRLLSQVMGAAVDNGLIPVTPCRGVKLPRMPEPKPRILTVAEVERLIAVTRAPHDLLVQLLAYTGVRIGEAFALRRRHVDLGNRRLTVAEALTEIGGRLTFDTPKSHQRRTVTLPGFLTEALRLHLRTRPSDPETLLFVGRTGKPLHYNSWRRTHFDPAVQAAKLDGVTPHALRATHASWVADRYGPLEAGRRLGHSNASVTTRHYARPIEGRDLDVAASLDDEREGAQGEDRARNGHDGDEDGSPEVT